MIRPGIPPEITIKSPLAILSGIMIEYIKITPQAILRLNSSEFTPGNRLPVQPWDFSTNSPNNFSRIS